MTTTQQERVRRDQEAARARRREAARTLVHLDGYRPPSPELRDALMAIGWLDYDGTEAP